MNQARVGLMVGALLRAAKPLTSAWPAMAVRRSALTLLAAGAVALAPLTVADEAWAQPKPAEKAGDKAAGDKAVAGDKAAGDKPAETAEGGEAPGGDTEGTEGGTEPTEGSGEGEGEGLADICAIDKDACPSVDFDKAAARPLDAEMYAVQQIYALKRMRFEINPYFAATMNDQFVSHPAFGLAGNFYITNVIAVGVNGNIYAGLNSASDFNLETSRAGRVGQSLTEYQWNANANFTYVPAYGKFAGFGDFIFHYDFFLVGGVGAISTRPIAVVDPDNRTFDFKPKVSFNLGLGLRIFFNRWLGATLEIRDYIFPDELENPEIAKGVDSEGRPAAQNADTWLAPDVSWTNNVQAQIGVSIFVPFTWEYELQK